MKKITNILVLFSLLAFIGFTTSCGSDDNPPTPKEETVIDPGTNLPVVEYIDSGNGIGTRTLSADTTYYLDGRVFVNSGQTLTIEAGTVIKGKAGQGENASALVVARGGKIMATGTASKPIIFTAVSDKLDGSAGITRGAWGGVIILGAASLNSAPGESAIEGIPAATEPRGLYGGTNDTDNSGVLKYVSIRHGGVSIGANNEINGLTLGGVGSGTTLEYIEVFANADDGVEFFGGTANIKYLIVAFCADDAIDYDEGYRGSNQFVIVYQGTDTADRGGEHDGGTDPETATPYATPTFANVTSIGKGDTRAITFRDNAGGKYYNSVFVNYSKGIDVELLNKGDEDSYLRFQAGDLKIANCVFNSVADGTATGIFKISAPDGTDAAVVATATTNFQASFSANNNEVTDLGISRTSIVPTKTSGTNATLSGTFFTTVDYKGAIAPNATPWYNGWTVLQSNIN